MKKQNGITLIALIITIIVLLILAVVTIGAVQDSDIIGHAENAANKYENEKLEEEMQLAITEINMDTYSNPYRYISGFLEGASDDSCSMVYEDADGNERTHHLFEVVVEVLEKSGFVIDDTYKMTYDEYEYDGKIYSITLLIDDDDLKITDNEDLVTIKIPVTYKNINTNILVDITYPEKNNKISNFRIAE